MLTLSAVVFFIVIVRTTKVLGHFVSALKFAGHEHPNLTVFFGEVFPSTGKPLPDVQEYMAGVETRGKQIATQVDFARERAAKANSLIDVSEMSRMTGYMSEFFYACSSRRVSFLDLLRINKYAGAMIMLSRDYQGELQARIEGLAKDIMAWSRVCYVVVPRVRKAIGFSKEERDISPPM